jgi:hypothetical protein
MPIVIKELLSQDPLSEAIEKINFNFDQLLLAGGGPPGPQGPQGIPGPNGPQGDRGDHWFTGASAFGQTADHDGNSPLQVEDHFLDPTGDVYDYFDDGLGSTGWTYSGINLQGPQGETGATGSSYEWDIYPGGSVGSANDGFQISPTTPSILVDNADINWIAPINPEKNVMTLGPQINWFYNNLIEWNTVETGLGSDGPTGPYYGNIPKLSIIQRNINYHGLNGISIGAIGLTGATDSTPANLLRESSNTDTVSGYNFINLGIAAKQTYTDVEDDYWHHVGIIKSLKTDLQIEAGDSAVPGTNDPTRVIRIRSNRLFYKDWEDNKYLLADERSDARGLILEAKNDPSKYSYVNLQGIPGSRIYSGGYGSVIIGSTASNGFNLNTVGGGGAGLIINRGIGGYSTSDSHITLIHPTTATSVNDYSARFVGISSASDRKLLISTNQLGIVGRATTLSTNQEPLFPLHVNQHGSTPSTSYWTGAPTIGNGFAGFLSGFDWGNSSSNRKRGLAIGLVELDSDSTQRPLIQGYYTSSSVSDDDSRGYTFSNFPAAPRTTSHIYSQLGDENYFGNFGFGIGQFTQALSKVSIGGSIRIGSISNGYHDETTLPGNSDFKHGALIEGKILRGSTSLSDHYSTSALTSSGFLTAIGSTSKIGIASEGTTISDRFISRERQTNGITEPSYALADLKTGINYSGATGEADLVVPSESSIDGSVTSLEAATWSNRGNLTSGNYSYSDNVDLTTVEKKIGFSVQGQFAKDIDVITSTDLAISYTRGMSGYIPPTGTGSDYRSWRYLLTEIPTKKSVVFLDLSSAPSSYVRFTTNTYASGSSTMNTATVSTSNAPNYGLYDAETLIGNPNVYNFTDDWGTGDFLGKVFNGGYAANRLFTLESGKYIGQTLTLIIGDVYSNGTKTNVFPIFQMEPVPDANGSPLSSTVLRPRIIMNSESVFDSLRWGGAFDSELDLASPLHFGNPIQPEGSSKAPFPNSATKAQNYDGFTGTGSGSPDASFDVNKNELYGISLGGLTLADTNGYRQYGYFLTFPWRTISFVWAPSGPNSNNKYCWIETSREYLSGDRIPITLSPDNGAIAVEDDGVAFG